MFCFCAVQFNINGNELGIEGGKTLADCLESNTTITRVRCEYICAGKQHSAPEAESGVQLHVLSSHMSGFFVLSQWLQTCSNNHLIHNVHSIGMVLHAVHYLFTSFWCFVILTRCILHD